MAYGWHGYLFSFMFNQIKESDNDRMEEMKKQLGWFYGRLAKASVPKAKQPTYQNDRKDDACVDDVAKKERENDRRKQNENDRTLELTNQERKRAGRLPSTTCWSSSARYFRTK